jgi:uncharacterized protein YukE
VQSTKIFGKIKKHAEIAGRDAQVRSKPAYRYETMEKRGITLDEEAKELYSRLEGLEDSLPPRRPFAGGDLTDSFTEAEKRFHLLRTNLAELVGRVAACLDPAGNRMQRDDRRVSFQRLHALLQHILRFDERHDAVIIRYRGGCGQAKGAEDRDYEIICGEILLDLELIHNLSRRKGVGGPALENNVASAFNIFSKNGISVFLLRIPQGEKSYRQFWLSLRILYCILQALRKKSPVSYKIGQRKLSYPMIKNEYDQPDINLTLLAILNGLPREKMQKLVDKVAARMRRADGDDPNVAFATVYDAITDIRIFKEKLTIPPIEINNIKWLLVEQEHKPVSSEMARIARIVMEKFENSGPQASRVLTSVYGNDYQRINSGQVIERLQAASGLLDTIDTKPKERKLEAEVLGNVEQRLGCVNDKIYEDITIENNRIGTNEKQTFIEKVHHKLFNLLTFYKNRSVAKKKMTDMVYQVIDFDHQDYETIARDFQVDPQDAVTLIALLKRCFDERGNFRKRVFVNTIPDLERYERRIFDFLWHNLKDSLYHEDRAAFLDALQLLVDRLKQRKNSLSVILNDLAGNPSAVRFADRKAFMLGNRLVRNYSDQIISYQITPEDILNDRAHLNRQVTNYAAWKIDRGQEMFFAKMKTIHRRLAELLDREEGRALMTAKDLCSLEREAYIFYALVGGNTGQSILMSALKEFGNSQSAIYHLKHSRKHLADLLHLLKIVIRGLLFVGVPEGRLPLESVKSQLSHFSEQVSSIHEHDQILQIRDLVSAAHLKSSAGPGTVEEGGPRAGS